MMYDNDNHQDDARPIRQGNYNRDGVTDTSNAGNKWIFSMALLGAVVSFVTTNVLLSVTQLGPLAVLLISVLCTLVVCIPVAVLTQKIMRYRKRTELLRKYPNN